MDRFNFQWYFAFVASISALCRTQQPFLHTNGSFSNIFWYSSSSRFIIYFFCSKPTLPLKAFLQFLMSKSSSPTPSFCTLMFSWLRHTSQQFICFIQLMISSQRLQSYLQACFSFEHFANLQLSFDSFIHCMSISLSKRVFILLVTSFPKMEIIYLSSASAVMLMLLSFPSKFLIHHSRYLTLAAYAIQMRRMRASDPPMNRKSILLVIQKNAALARTKKTEKAISRGLFNLVLFSESLQRVSLSMNYFLLLSESLTIPSRVVSLFSQASLPTMKERSTVMRSTISWKQLCWYISSSVSWASVMCPSYPFRYYINYYGRQYYHNCRPMSELSFLIETQNQPVVDESYLQKCRKEDSESRDKESGSLAPTRVLSSKELKINRNFLVNWKKAGSPRSINYNNTSVFKSETSDANEELYKIGLRVDALDENQKRLQQRFGKQFMALQDKIFQSKNDYNILSEDLNKIRGDMKESKKNIGQLLSHITAKSK